MALATTSRQSRLAHERQHEPTCVIFLASLIRGFLGSRIDRSYNIGFPARTCRRNGDLVAEIPEPKFQQVLAEWLQFFARSGHWPGHHVLHVLTSKFEP